MDLLARQEKQQELAIMAAALAAAEAVGDAMSPKEKAAEVGLAVAESAAAAGMSLEEQMEAHRCIGGRFWVDV